MSKSSEGIHRREFLGLSTAAALAAAVGTSWMAEASVDGPMPARIEELNSDNPHGAGCASIGWKSAEAENAGAMLHLGQLDEARFLIQKAIRGAADPQVAEFYASLLSYLVDDPEIAAQLLGIACQTHHQKLLFAVTQSCALGPV